MADMTGPDELLAEVLGRYANAPNPRLKEVMESAIRHLHAFARDVNLQRDEWMAGIQFLTATGQMCSDTRQEFILMSDTLGVSTLVEMLSYAASEGTTENTVLGPFYVPGSPERAFGETMLDDDDHGDKVVVRGVWDGEEEARVVGDRIEDFQRKRIDIRGRRLQIRIQFVKSIGAAAESLRIAAEAKVRIDTGDDKIGEVFEV